MTTAGRVAAVLLVLAPASPAAAADLLTMFDWACDPDAANTQSITADLLSTCQLSGGARSACQVVSGTPTACNQLSAGSATNRTCREGSVTFTIQGDVGSALGWTVSGTLTVAASYSYKISETTCTATPIQPPPDGGAGTYVGRAGKATATASFTASGTGSVTFLGGTIFSVSHTQTCSRSLTADGHHVSSAAACTRKTCSGATTGTGTTTGPGTTTGTGAAIGDTAGARQICPVDAVDHE